MIDIRLPNITGATEREQLIQVKSYLHQLAEQLQWALQNVDTSNNSVVAAPTARSLAPSIGNASGEINAQATFASIKSLIIKSAEIVDAYYEEINNKLVGLYVAQSDFGTYVEQTEAKFEATSKDITQTYTNIQTLESTVGGINTTVETLGETVQTIDGKVDTVAEEASTNLQEAKEGILGNVDALTEVVEGHSTAIQDVKDGTEQSIKDVGDRVDGLASDIDGVKTDVDEKTKALDEAIKATNVVVATVTGTIKTGELYKDEMGLPVYGLEIGQINEVNGVETFNKYARFTSSRLSFYDKYGEVAWISNNQLHITEAEVTGNLKIGGYLIETSNGIAFKWVGR